MVRRSVALAPLLLVFAALQVHPEGKGVDPKEALQSLLSNVLKVTIAARVLPADEKPAWNAQSTKLTLPGRSIRVRLDGDNVRIHLVCTPYMQDNGEVLLLAQGQVWFATPTQNELTYSSTFSSIPVSFGEKVLFFPLGISDARAQQKGAAKVEVEIKVLPYSGAGKQEQPSAGGSAERVLPYGGTGKQEQPPAGGSAERVLPYGGADKQPQSQAGGSAERVLPYGGADKQEQPPAGGSAERVLPYGGTGKQEQPQAGGSAERVLPSDESNPQPEQQQ
jgi:hypothetical protein